MSQPPNTRSSSEESGTTSLIFGERPSVRLPRRTVPICVSDPIGLAIPLRIASTPAIVVVLTAPRPTSITPSLPRAGAMSTGVGMKDGSYSFQLSAVSCRLSAVGCRLSAERCCKLRAESYVLEEGEPLHVRRRHDRREDGRSA